MQFSSNFDICKSLPKVELHAHLNGSLSKKTLCELGSSIEDIIEYQRLEKLPPNQRSLDECFRLFGFAHKATTTPEALYVAAKNVIQEFSNDNVIYLELRTTPRGEVAMNAETYIEAVVKAVEDDTNDILVKLILSINRKQALEHCEKNLDLILRMKEKYPNVIKGVDLSGDPHHGHFDELQKLLEKARKNGVFTTLHCAEVKNDEEVGKILNFRPDRIGHAPFLHPSFGGCWKNWELLRNLQIPTEICITSNIITGTTKSYEQHHIREWIKHDLPFSLNTDDKGVFHTNLSLEFGHAMTYFHLTPQDLWKISWNSVDHSFATAEEKSTLKDKLREWHNKNLDV